MVYNGLYKEATMNKEELDNEKEDKFVKTPSQLRETEEGASTAFFDDGFPFPDPVEPVTVKKKRYVSKKKKPEPEEVTKHFELFNDNFYMTHNVLSTNLDNRLHQNETHYGSDLYYQ
jgi:hypothetical protein